MDNIRGYEKMKEIIDSYMDNENIRVFCFFKNKYDPESKICSGCARKSQCERDAKKMLLFFKTIPWLESAYEKEMKKYYKECPSCG